MERLSDVWIQQCKEAEFLSFLFIFGIQKGEQESPLDFGSVSLFRLCLGEPTDGLELSPCVRRVVSGMVST